ncbi:DNA recombination protein RmuC [Parvularcula marina]|uniref:DNA recombination protein RmuC homolog n=1 Tax=Parvularcula marina TaxID=2292771 RepID=A0A371RHX4_9PROT|nr:DNA recombination protein RmuC [Parvularcula marina]RFB05035.1 DNA recombination protein RmuC [Parvularcula marina]
MILDVQTLLFAAAISGWLAALFLLVLRVRAGREARQLDDELTAAKGELVSLGARLEAFDAVRDELEYEREKTGRLERESAALATRLEEREANLKELRDRLENEFRSMSQKLLREAGDTLLREAKQNFEKQQVMAKADAEGYSKSVTELLKPMRETLTRYEQGLREMRDQQKAAQGELTGQIRSLTESASAVQAEARTLAAALKAGPRTRGRWGETTLRNVVELTGMSAYCDFTEQRAVAGEDGAGRKQPDMVVTLPGERLVAIDSKVSLSDWLDAAGTEDEAERAAALSRHGDAIWSHVRSLAAKDYASALKKEGAMDFVVMFIPGENFFTAAIEARPNLFEDAFQRDVLIATPTTLIAILKSIAQSWRQQKASENARVVAGLAQDLYDSLRTTGGYLQSLGKSLGRTVGEYNKLVGNMESRVLPRARKFAEYEMPGTEKVLEEVPSNEELPRLPDESRGFLLEADPAPKAAANG